MFTYVYVYCIQYIHIYHILLMFCLYKHACMIQLFYTFFTEQHHHHLAFSWCNSSAETQTVSSCFTLDGWWWSRVSDGGPAVKHSRLETAHTVTGCVCTSGRVRNKWHTGRWHSKLTWLDISIIAIFSWGECRRQMKGYRVVQTVITINYKSKTEGWIKLGQNTYTTMGGKTVSWRTCLLLTSLQNLSVQWLCPWPANLKSHRCVIWI